MPVVTCFEAVAVVRVYFISEGVSVLSLPMRITMRVDWPKPARESRLMPMPPVLLISNSIAVLPSVLPPLSGSSSVLHAESPRAATASRAGIYRSGVVCRLVVKIFVVQKKFFVSSLLFEVGVDVARRYRNPGFDSGGEGNLKWHEVLHHYIVSVATAGTPVECLFTVDL